jgi:hypothetical protein
LENILPTQPFIYKDDTGKKAPLLKEKIRTILAEIVLQISSEMQLIDAVEKWAELVIEYKKKAKTFASIRAEVDYLMPNLRVLSLEEREFSQFLDRTLLFSPDEKNKLRTAYKTKVIYF